MSDRSPDGLTSTHGGELLSALLDGELRAAEREAVVLHVTGCGECAGELAALRAARLALRSLPAVDPPPGFLAGLVPPRAVVGRAPARQGRRGSTRLVAAQVAAAAAAALVVAVGAGSWRPVPVSAQVGGAVERHAAAAGALEVGLGGASLLPTPVTPTTSARRPVRELGAPFVAPEDLAGYRRVGVFQADGVVQVLYRRGKHGLSVFEEEGELEGGSLPIDGSPVQVDGATAWRWDDPRAAGRVVVMERDGLVVTVVGDESADAVLEVVRALPGPAGPSVGARLRAACAGALRLLGPAPG